MMQNMKFYNDIWGASLKPRGLGNRRLLDCHGFYNGLVESGGCSIFTGFYVLSAQPTDASLSRNNLCRQCTCFCMQRGIIRFHTVGLMAQFDSGVSNMQCTRERVGIFILAFQICSEVHQPACYHFLKLLMTQ
jgi:hypothetical protein